MAPVFSKQPGKALATLAYTLFVYPPTILYHMIRNIFKSLRHDPEWSYKGSLVGPLVQTRFNCMTTTRDQLPMLTEPGHFGDRFEIVQVPEPKYFTGLATPTETIKPKPLPGVWFPARLDPDSAANEKVILHYPGGAFVTSFGTQFMGQILNDGLVERMGATKLYFAQYRLARDDESRFPAALQDAITFYAHVLSLGIKPSNIMISGDSAGGNLALALLRYLETGASGLPSPRGVITWSPWVSVPADAGAEFVRQRHAEKDMLTYSFLQWGADAYRPAGKLGEEVEAIINPLHHPFKTRVPVFLQAGGREGFRDPIEEFSKEMQELNGDNIKFHESRLAIHDLIIVHSDLGMTKDNEAAIDAAREHVGEW